MRATIEQRFGFRLLDEVEEDHEDDIPCHGTDAPCDRAAEWVWEIEQDCDHNESEVYFCSMHHYQTLSYNTDYWLCAYCNGPVDIVKRTLLR